MGWMAILQLILSIVDKVFTHFVKKDQVDEGKLKELMDQIKVLDVKVEQAERARAAVANNACGLHLDDGFRRD